MVSIQKETLLGYDAEIENARQMKFDEFNAATGPKAQRSAFQSFASLTARRSPTFIAELERAKGLRSDK